MLKELAKVLALYLAPILSLVGPLLVAVSYISPVAKMKILPSLVVVKPSRLLVKNSSRDEPDGPSVFFGILRSCSRAHNFEQIKCTYHNVKPTYNITALSDDAPSLFDPAVATPHLIAVSLCLSGIFFILFTVFALRATWGNRLFSTWLLTQLDRPMALRVSTWLGLSGFVIGTFSFGIVRIWFGKSVIDFNESVEAFNENVGADDELPLIAKLSGGFAMGWAGYALQAVPIICALMKIYTA